MARFDLARHRGRLVREVLPRYGTLGPLAFAYLQGSLVRGDTDDADLDVIAVWADPAVPTARAAVVDYRCGPGDVLQIHASFDAHAPQQPRAIPSEPSGPPDTKSRTRANPSSSETAMLTACGVAVAQRA